MTGPPPHQMRPDDVVYVAGHRGLVGSALVRRMHRAGYRRLVHPPRSELDLCDQSAVFEFFRAVRPDCVFMAAAKVGGICANATYPGDFIYQNLVIESNVLGAAKEFGVRKLLFLGSSCIYPRLAPQPMREECLLTGPLEPTNEAYAIAKIAGVKLCVFFNKQYGTDFIAAMPTNLYGIADNYDPDNSHVLPALIRKMHEAKERGASSVTLWGTGTPRREFLFADDLADACVFLMETSGAAQVSDVINIGAGSDQTIRDLAEVVAAVVGYRGEILFDPSRPDGTPRKLLDVSRLSNLGWTASTPLETGVRLAYQDFLVRFRDLRNR